MQKTTQHLPPTNTASRGRSTTDNQEHSVVINSKNWTVQTLIFILFI